MKTIVKKVLVSVLCLAFFVAGIGSGAVPAMAQTIVGTGSVRTTYSLSELKQVGNFGEVEVSGQGAEVSLSFAGLWNQAFFAVPEEILAAGLRGYECRFKAGSSSYSLKLVGTGGAYKGIGITYGSSKVTVVDLESSATMADIEDIKNIGIMNLKDGPNTLVIESITFMINQELDEKDIVNLKDAMTAAMGDGFIVGTAIDNADLADDREMQLLTKHFNAVTIGNQLKPQFLLTNVYGDKYPQDQLQTTSLNGKSLSVPKLDFTSSERSLDYIYSWNQKHPSDQIKVRGHVLVWHSQTPEWFFHEDYDSAKPYVDKETMSLREEWYIKSVAEHFMGAGSKYKDLFYAWDVVNEAASDDWTDPNHIYRTDKDDVKSGWWAVYQSNQFITDAFVFANKYMPKSVELYYNDYNDCWDAKVKHIVELLKAVKAAPGARIDGMGMQAHYSVKADGISPDGELFKKAVRAYCEVVDHVQITELDFTASDSYDGTSRTQAAEDERIAARYKEIYDAVKSLNAEGRKVTGMTVWGLIDKNSWLNGTTGKTQCPLLFDNEYHAKKSFYVLADGYQASKPVTGGTDEPAAGDEPATEEPPVEEEPSAQEPAVEDVSAIRPKTESITLKKGKSIFFELADGVNTEQIKSITYQSNKKKVAAVNKKGKITAKKKGTATIKAVVTLQSGAKKTVKMKVKVK